MEQKWKTQAALLKKQAQTRLESRYGKTGNKHLQLVLQHCCKTSWKTTLRVLPPMFQPVLQQIKLLQKVESSLTFCNKICHVNEIWNKSYMNCGNEMKMKKWSSQWTQFTQLNKLRSLQRSFLHYQNLTSCAFYRPKANLFCSKRRNSRIILSNQKSVLTQPVSTWFVARQVWKRVVQRERRNSTHFAAMFRSKLHS